MKTTLYNTFCISLLSDKKGPCHSMMSQVGKEKSATGTKFPTHFDSYQNQDNPNSCLPRFSLQPIKMKTREKNG